MPLGVGWQGCQLHTHIHTPPTSAYSSPSRTLPGQFTHSPRFWVCWFLTHRFLDEFGLTQEFCSSPRVAEAPTHCNSRPCCCFVHPRAKTELFLFTQGLHCLLFSLLGRIVYPRVGILLFGLISHVRGVLTVNVLGLLSSPRICVSCGVQIRFGPLWNANLLVVYTSVHAGGFAYPSFGTVHSCHSFPL